MLDQTVDAERALSGPPWTGRGSLLGSAAGRATGRSGGSEGHGWIRGSTFGCGDTSDVNTRVATATSAALNTEIVSADTCQPRTPAAVTIVEIAPVITDMSSGRVSAATRIVLLLVLL